MDSNSIETVFRQGWRMRWARAKNCRDTYSTTEELIDYLGRRRRVSDIGEADLLSLVMHWQSKGLSNARINRKLSVLRPLLRFAKKLGYYPNPIPELDHMSEGQGRERFLSRAEAEALLDHIDPEYEPLTRFLLMTGARYGEAIALRWDDISPTQVTFRWTTTKTGKTRTVPLEGTCHTRLEPLRRHRPIGPFVGTVYDRFHRAFRKAVEAAGLDRPGEVVPHTLRHSCASWMAQGGVPIRHIQKWLGHSSVVTTERYAKLTQEDLSSALDVLSGPVKSVSSMTSQMCQGVTFKKLDVPAIPEAYAMGECPERQRGRTVNPDEPQEIQSFIDLYED